MMLLVRHNALKVFQLKPTTNNPQHQGSTVVWFQSTPSWKSSSCRLRLRGRTRREHDRNGSSKRQKNAMSGTEGEVLVDSYQRSMRLSISVPAGIHTACCCGASYLTNLLLRRLVMTRAGSRCKASLTAMGRTPSELSGFETPIVPDSI